MGRMASTTAVKSKLERVKSFIQRRQSREKKLPQYRPHHHERTKPHRATGTENWSSLDIIHVAPEICLQPDRHVRHSTPLRGQDNEVQMTKEVLSHRIRRQAAPYGIVSGITLHRFHAKYGAVRRAWPYCTVPYRAAPRQIRCERSQIERGFFTCSYTKLCSFYATTSVSVCLSVCDGSALAHYSYFRFQIPIQIYRALWSRGGVI